MPLKTMKMSRNRKNYMNSVNIPSEFGINQEINSQLGQNKQVFVP